MDINELANISAADLKRSDSKYKEVEILLILGIMSKVLSFILLYFEGKRNNLNFIQRAVLNRKIRKGLSKQEREHFNNDFTRVGEARLLGLNELNYLSLTKEAKLHEYK